MAPRRTPRSGSGSRRTDGRDGIDAIGRDRGARICAGVVTPSIPLKIGVSASTLPDANARPLPPSREDCRGHARPAPTHSPANPGKLFFRIMTSRNRKDSSRSKHLKSCVKEGSAICMRCHNRLSRAEEGHPEFFKIRRTIDGAPGSSGRYAGVWGKIDKRLGRGLSCATSRRGAGRALPVARAARGFRTAPDGHATPGWGPRWPPLPPVPAPRPEGVNGPARPGGGRRQLVHHREPLPRARQARRLDAPAEVRGLRQRLEARPPPLEGRGRGLTHRGPASGSATSSCPSGWMKRFPRLGMRPIRRTIDAWRGRHAPGARLGPGDDLSALPLPARPGPARPARLFQHRRLRPLLAPARADSSTPWNARRCARPT